MLSYSPISGAPISGATGDIVIVAPAFRSTGILRAAIGTVLAKPLVSVGALSATAAIAVSSATLTSAGVLSAMPLASIIAPAMESVSAISAQPSRFEIHGEIYRYYFTLTGSPDIEIPITSFQCRLRSGDPSYLSVTIPYTDAYAAAITARASGEMIIHRAMILFGEEIVRSEIARVTLENIRTDEGSNSSTITLTGHKTQSFTVTTMTLQNATYRSITDGSIRLRFAEPVMYLQPGSTIIYDGDSFTADLISIFVGISEGGNLTQSMEVAESG